MVWVLLRLPESRDQGGLGNHRGDDGDGNRVSKTVAGVTVPLGPPSFSGHHSLVERGAFAVWYWNLHDLGADVFGLAGVSAGGGFFAAEVAPGGTTALLFGFSSDLDLGLFGIGGGALPIQQFGLSEGAMEADASLAEAALTSLGLVTSGRGVGGIGGLAAAIINGAAVLTWVHYTYGKEQQQ